MPQLTHHSKDQMYLKLVEIMQKFACIYLPHHSSKFQESFISVCVCICLYVCVYAYAYSMCTPVYVVRPEEGIGCPVQLTF